MQQGIINRRYLRVKAFQALYAFEAESTDVNVGEQNMLKSIDRVYDLYLYLLRIPLELKHKAEVNIEQNKNKRIKTDADLQPNLKFIENKAFKVFEQNTEFAKINGSRKIEKLVDDELMRKLWRDIRSSEMYQKYMDDPQRDFEADKKFMIKLFKKKIATYEHLQDHFEDISIYWQDDLGILITNVIQTINGLPEDAKPYDDVLLPLFKDEKADVKFVKDLFRKTVLNKGELTKLVDDNTTNWDFDRIAKLDTILLKMAVCELLYFPSIPVKVTMNEYIELAGDYSTPKSKSFINGVLDKLTQKLQKEGSIVKSGRGLIN